MRTKSIKSCTAPYFGAGGGDVEYYTHVCPCGKGSIEEEHDNIPGFRDHSVRHLCKNCSKKYVIDEREGIRNWKLVKIK